MRETHRFKSKRDTCTMSFGNRVFLARHVVGITSEGYRAKVSSVVLCTKRIKHDI